MESLTFWERILWYGPQPVIGLDGLPDGTAIDLLPDDPGTGGEAPPPPVVLAQEAVSRLQLPSPRLVMNPAGTQVVHVPTWLWLAPASWAPVSATAQVPGVSVTASAVPRRVTWDMDDGGRVVCTGPGTPYGPGYDPAAPSPDCGHTYGTSSAGRPGEVYRVTVSVAWDVTWTGGGQEGAVPGLVTTATAAVRVAEIQAVVVPPS